MDRRVAGALLVMAAAWIAAPGLGANEAVSSTALDELEAAAADLLEETSTEPLRLSMEFQDANLGDVLKTFSQQTGINVIAGSEIADRPITVYLEEVEVLDALDQILSAGNLTYERPAGSAIYIVKPRPAEELPRLMTRVYRLKYARVSESVLARTASAFAERTPFEAILKLEEGGAGGGAAAGKRAGIDLTVEKLLSKDGALVVDPRTNSLVITDVPANFPRLEAAIAALDIRTRQIMVESEVIETTLTKLKDLGFEWGTGATGKLASFTPSATGRKTRFPFTLFGEERTATDATPFTASTLSFGDFKGFLQALETDTDTKILARPRVLTLDNESAVIRLTSDEAIGFSSTGQATTNTVTSAPERKITGVVLVVTPQINDGNNITMVVEPSVTKTVASLIDAPSGGQQAKPRDPKTRSSRTLVRIHSGDTLVVGGLIDRSESESLRQVPILGGIPFLGEAFKNTNVNDSASELMVFVTPRILEEAAEAQVASAGPTAAPREQEPSGSRQELIEQTLNRFEQPHL